MICIETDHLRLTRILLFAIGVWPYDRSLLTQIRCILLFSILITSIIFQLTALSTSECTIKLALKTLSVAVCFSVFALKYNSFMIHSHTVNKFLYFMLTRVKEFLVKYLIEYLKNICNNLKDENEIAIMKHYGSMTTRFTFRLILLTYVCLFFGLLMTLWPKILDIVLSTNESRCIVLPVITYYFVEQEKYCYLIFLHMGAGMCIGAIALVGTGTMLIAYFKHASAIISIARYRFLQTIDQSKNTSLENATIICKRIACAVDIHRKALEFCIVLISNFEGSFLCLIIFLVLGLSLNLFSALVNRDNIGEVILHFLCVIPMFLYAMICNYSVQEVMDNNNDLFISVYNIQWYKAPLKIQKLILFLLQRGTKSFTLIIGRVYVASIEGAGKMISTSISYFTVLYSTQ